MRFLGNKTSLIGEIDAFIMKSLSRQTGLVFLMLFVEPDLKEAALCMVQSWAI